MSATQLPGLWQRIAGVSDRGIRFIATNAPGTPDSEPFINYAELMRRAARTAERLSELGVLRGERVLISARTCPEFVVSWLALKLRGAVPVPVPPSEVFAGKDVFSERVQPLLAYHRFLIADPSDVAQIARSSALTCFTFDEVCRAPEPGDKEPEFREVAPEEEAFIQYTSGSTSRPKGVVISYANIVANVSAIKGAIGYDAERDVFISWLPLYHDMGLVGMLLNCMFNTTDLVLMPPQYFARRPLRFLKLAEKYRATHCALPNFALDWMLRAHRAKPETVDVASLKWIGIGSEPVSCETLGRFASTFEPFGLGTTVLSPCYGLAEATLAVSLSRPTRAFVSTEYEGASFPGVGPLVDEMEVRIESEGRVGAGRILVRGPSVAREALVDGQKLPLIDAQGFYDTKDLGFFSGEELVVLGRADEMFIVNGNNYFPYDIESIVRHQPGLPINRVACFATSRAGRPEVVVVVETRGAADVTDAVSTALFERAGLTVDHILSVPPKTILVTTSGKIRRRATRELYESGQLAQSTQQPTLENDHELRRPTSHDHPTLCRSDSPS